MLELLAEAAYADVFGYLMTFLWLFEWQHLAQVSHKVSQAMFRPVVNYAIWTRLASNVYFEVCIKLIEARISEDVIPFKDISLKKHARIYFGLRHEHDWWMTEESPRDDYVGVYAVGGDLLSDQHQSSLPEIMQRRQKLTNELRDVMDRYRRYLRTAIGFRCRLNLEFVSLVKTAHDGDSWVQLYRYNAQNRYASQAESILGRIGVYSTPVLWHSGMRDAIPLPEAPTSEVELALDQLFT